MNRLIVLVAILPLIAGFASAQPGSSNLDRGKELVAQLYKEHSGKSDPLQYPASKKLLLNYFYKPLLDRYLKDQEDSKGEVGKIDFDPLYDAQDFEISGFNLVVLPDKKRSGYVAARFKNMGVDQEIIFALQRTKMGWRIADIQYKDGRSLWKILKGSGLCLTTRCSRRHPAPARRCGAAELRTLDVDASFRVAAGKSSVVVHAHPDGDGNFLVAIEASVDGFCGHADGHVVGSGLQTFASQCRTLEERRQGVASFSSALEGEFTLSLQSIDSLGHLSVAGNLRYQRADADDGFAQRLDFEFAFDPSELQNVLRALNNV